MRNFLKLVLSTCLLFLCSCGAYFNQPFDKNPSRTGEFSASTKILLDLPSAADPVEVAVYDFSDQTGQYKAVENGSTFSTAVSQGGTTILIKALEDSGWFIPIERENFNNLSTERNIIRSTKQDYIKNLNPNEPPLPPLLYAGLILEGGVVSYDTNIITGGIGARYFGIGGSARYRQDRITVYLRAVSTNNGAILKTIYVSKTILSQAVDASFFRFVKFQRLLEAETGITQNEPVQLAMKDAIEKAVHDLILEGIKDQFWGAKGGKEVNDKLVADYLEGKEREESVQLYDRVRTSRPYKNLISASAGASLINADYTTKELGAFARFEYQREINPYLNLGVSTSFLELNSGDQFYNKFGAVDFNAQFNILPFDNLSPFIYAGPGLFREINDAEDGGYKLGETFFKLQYGFGIQYFLSESWGLKLVAEHNRSFSDEVDKLVNGKRKDDYLTFGLGLNYYFNFKKKNTLSNSP
tara:strand:+ start:3221 stop:4630 length:1410 start_codon:yes stop_codon:yes gene_type:complete